MVKLSSLTSRWKLILKHSFQLFHMNFKRTHAYKCDLNLWLLAVLSQPPNSRFSNVNFLKSKNQIILHAVEARRWDVAAAFWLSRSTCWSAGSPGPRRGSRGPGKVVWCAGSSSSVDDAASCGPSSNTWEENLNKLIILRCFGNDVVIR
jgi:hypothetical protein